MLRSRKVYRLASLYTHRMRYDLARDEWVRELHPSPPLVTQVLGWKLKLERLKRKDARENPDQD